jgi:hypothetical protein
VRCDGQREEWLFLTEAVVLPPVVARGEDADPVPTRGPPRATRGQEIEIPTPAPDNPTNRDRLPQVFFCFYLPSLNVVGCGTRQSPDNPTRRRPRSVVVGWCRVGVGSQSDCRVPTQVTAPEAVRGTSVGFVGLSGVSGSSRAFGEAANASRRAKRHPFPPAPLCGDRWPLFPPAQAPPRRSQGGRDCAAPRQQPSGRSASLAEGSQVHDAAVPDDGATHRDPVARGR